MDTLMFDIIKDRKIKVAIVGCGRIANNHFGSIEKHQESLELVGVCDTNAEALAAAVARWTLGIASCGVPGATR